MKTISANMQALLASDGIPALATFYLLKRRDGTILGFTDWTDNVTVGSVTYQAAEGYSRSALQQRADLAPANMQVTGIVTTGLITDEDIRAGLYNSATIQVWMAVPTDTDFLQYGRIQLPGQYVGEFKIQDGVYVLEIRGWAYALQQSYVEVYTPTCRADFCDARCKLNAAAFTMLGALTDDPANNVEFTITPTNFASNVSFGMTYQSLNGNNTNTAPIFVFGLLTFTSGENENYVVEVSNCTFNENGTVTIYLYLPAAHVPAAGDTVSVVSGCDKTVQSCLGYANVTNFRGEPMIPGASFLFDYGEVLP